MRIKGDCIKTSAKNAGLWRFVYNNIAFCLWLRPQDHRKIIGIGGLDAGACTGVREISDQALADKIMYAYKLEVASRKENQVFS